MVFLNAACNRWPRYIDTVYFELNSIIGKYYHIASRQLHNSAYFIGVNWTGIHIQGVHTGNQ